MKDFFELHSTGLEMQPGKVLGDFPGSSGVVAIVLPPPLPLQFVVDLRPERGEQQDAGAPWWVLVVSVMAGVSLLAAVILLLWKVNRKSLTVYYTQSKTDHFIKNQ